ncbi:unnamed protein product [Amoebophrya sp. A120]|nr:unnamed protein product [Amoebophrya sp. A120]|eukprot:GSA120T00014544001.1
MLNFVRLLYARISFGKNGTNTATASDMNDPATNVVNGSTSANASIHKEEKVFLQFGNFWKQLMLRFPPEEEGGSSSKHRKRNNGHPVNASSTTTSAQQTSSKHVALKDKEEDKKQLRELAGKPTEENYKLISAIVCDQSLLLTKPDNATSSKGTANIKLPDTPSSTPTAGRRRTNGLTSPTNCLQNNFASNEEKLQFLCEKIAKEFDCGLNFYEKFDEEQKDFLKNKPSSTSRADERSAPAAGTSVLTSMSTGVPLSSSAGTAATSASASAGGGPASSTHNHPQSCSGGLQSSGLTSSSSSSSFYNDQRQSIIEEELLLGSTSVLDARGSGFRFQPSKVEIYEFDTDGRTNRDLAAGRLPTSQLNTSASSRIIGLENSVFDENQNRDVVPHPHGGKNPTTSARTPPSSSRNPNQRIAGSFADDDNLTAAPSTSTAPATTIDMPYGHVCCGGTFDVPLHNGHKLLLTEALFLTKQRLVVGISGDDSLLLEKKKFRDLIALEQKRGEQVELFLKEQMRLMPIYQPSNSVSAQQRQFPRERPKAKLPKVFVTFLQDAAGPAGTDPQLEMIVVSAETKSGADFVNRCREAESQRYAERNQMGYNRAMPYLKNLATHVINDGVLVQPETCVASSQGGGAGTSSSAAGAVVSALFATSGHVSSSSAPTSRQKMNPQQTVADFLEAKTSSSTQRFRKLGAFLPHITFPGDCFDLVPAMLVPSSGAQMLTTANNLSAGEQLLQERNLLIQKLYEKRFSLYGQCEKLLAQTIYQVTKRMLKVEDNYIKNYGASNLETTSSSTSVVVPPPRTSTRPPARPALDPKLHLLSKKASQSLKMAKPLPVYVIGLCGSSGSGKTTIGKMLQEKYGFIYVDCDKIGREAYEDPESECYKQIIETFGQVNVVAMTSEEEERIITLATTISGALSTSASSAQQEQPQVRELHKYYPELAGRQIDRRKLGKIVFSDKAKREQLNGIVWPSIWQTACLQIAEEVEEFECAYRQLQEEKSASQRNSLVTDRNRGTSKQRSRSKSNKDNMQVAEAALGKAEALARNVTVAVNKGGQQDAAPEITVDDESNQPSATSANTKKNKRNWKTALQFCSNRIVAVLDAAVLLEAQWPCDEVWSVFCNREVQVERIMARDHITQEQAENRLGAQISNKKRVAVSDVVLTSQFDRFGEPVRTAAAAAPVVVDKGITTTSTTATTTSTPNAAGVPGTILSTSSSSSPPTRTVEELNRNQHLLSFTVHKAVTELLDRVETLVEYDAEQVVRAGTSQQMRWRPGPRGTSNRLKIDLENNPGNENQVSGSKQLFEGTHELELPAGTGAHPENISSSKRNLVERMLRDADHANSCSPPTSCPPPAAAVKKVCSSPAPASSGGGGSCASTGAAAAPTARPAVVVREDAGRRDGVPRGGDNMAMAAGGAPQSSTSYLQQDDNLLKNKNAVVHQEQDPGQLHHEHHLPGQLQTCSGEDHDGPRGTADTSDPSLPRARPSFADRVAVMAQPRGSAEYWRGGLHMHKLQTDHLVGPQMLNKGRGGPVCSNYPIIQQAVPSTPYGNENTQHSAAGVAMAAPLDDHVNNYPGGFGGRQGHDQGHDQMNKQQQYHHDQDNHFYQQPSWTTSSKQQSRDVDNFYDDRNNYMASNSTSTAPRPTGVRPLNNFVSQELHPQPAVGRATSTAHHYYKGVSCSTSELDSNFYSVGKNYKGGRAKNSPTFGGGGRGGPQFSYYQETSRQQQEQNWNGKNYNSENSMMPRSNVSGACTPRGSNRDKNRDQSYFHQ